MNKFTDTKGRPIIAITGAGIVSSLGVGKTENWTKLTSGKSGIHAITRFPVDHLKTTIAGTVDFLTKVEEGWPALTYALAQSATIEALAQAGFSSHDFAGPLFLASPPVELEWQSRFELEQFQRKWIPVSRPELRENNEIELFLDSTQSGKALNDQGAALSREETGYRGLLAAARKISHRHYNPSIKLGAVAEKLHARIGARGLPITLSTACASGATAIQVAVESLRRGDADRAIAIGTDGSIYAESLIRFSLLSALSTQNDDPQRASKPFSKDRDGFVMGEGAAALVVETLEAAIGRGAKILGILEGCGECADDFHRTRSKPDGSPAIAAIKSALDDAAIQASDISYINAHGTSTPENDKMEALSLIAVFGDGLSGIPLSSNKSMIGHTMTAAGAIEAVFSLLTIQNGTLPPTINYDIPDPAIDIDVVPNQKRDARVWRVLSNSFGFGGQNACLVIAAEPA